MYALSYCFSSIDNHTQYAYSKLHSGVLGLVIEIKPNGERGNADFFEMSKVWLTFEVFARLDSNNEKI